MDSFKPLVRFAGFEGEWEIERFGDIIEECFDKSTIENEDTLLSSSISGMYLNSELFGHQRGQSNIGYRKVRKNMLVLSAQNLHLGNANVNLRFDHGLVSPAYKIYDIIGANPEFMAHWIKREQTKDFFLNATTEGASLCRKNIIWEDLYDQYLSLPSLPEQQAISNYFTKLDEELTLQSQKLSKLKQIKAASLQNMFPQEGHNVAAIRFHGFRGEWKCVKLNSFAKRITRKNANLESTLALTIASAHGLVSQMDYFNNLVVGSNIYNYYLIKKGEFAYNKSSSSGYPFGSVKRLDFYEKGILSTLYIVFDIDETVSSDYVVHYFDSSLWHSEIAKVATEGARNHGLLNIGAEDFLNIHISLPSLPEQQAIANYFTKLDRKIDLETQKLEKLKQIKAASLSKMFV